MTTTLTITITITIMIDPSLHTYCCRYYSIRLPMHHAAHMSVGKTVVAVLLVWLWAGVLSALPLLGLGAYQFRLRRYHCAFAWHKAYVALVATLGFLLPGLVLLVMYVGIFRVARHAARQVRGSGSGFLFFFFFFFGCLGWGVLFCWCLVGWLVGWLVG